MVGDGTWLTTGEAAKVAGVSKSTIVKLLNLGQLPYGTVPGSTHRRIRRTDAEALKLRIEKEERGGE